MSWFVAAGAAVTVAGKVVKGRQAKKAAKRNAVLAQAQANDALLRGVVEESRYRREVAGVLGAQRATFGFRNVTQSGTALEILADTAMIGSEDEQTIRNNAAREAWGYRNDAAAFKQDAKNIGVNTAFGAAGSALSGGADLYQQYKTRSG